MLKGVHIPDQREALLTCLRRFLDSYGAGSATSDAAHLCGLVGCLLLARVVGSSPVEYLTASEADHVERAGAEALTSSLRDINDIWTAVVTSLRR